LLTRVKYLTASREEDKAALEEMNDNVEIKCRRNWN
jgi:hypothetical protein